jgi:hypothetical protein
LVRCRLQAHWRKLHLASIEFALAHLAGVDELADNLGVGMVGAARGSLAAAFLGAFLREVREGVG